MCGIVQYSHISLLQHLIWSRLRLGDQSSHRVLRQARSLADLVVSEDIGPAHLAEAIHTDRDLTHPGP
jgi:predicted ATPase with chaperone activity